MGQAPDEGLFVPEAIPKIDTSALARLRGRPFAETAFFVLSAFLKDEIGEKLLREITMDAFDFPVPLEPVDERTIVMRLDRGPTASFKDFAARTLARLMQRMKPPSERLTVLVATSGDTGSAVGEAFKELESVRVFILYPRNEVSAQQKKQLDTIGDNVSAVSVDGKFDDCQNLVKRAFGDADLKPLRLTSANSINFGRILPQMTYYAYAWAERCNPGEEIVFSVPSGNFGNAFACETARRMGLPVGMLILATNENDEFPRFLETGLYEKISPSLNCLSNAMNVGHPSNLARFFELYGGTVDKNGVVWKPPDRAEMVKRLYSVSVSDDETRATIKNVYDRQRLVLEPHGAVGWAGLEKYRRERNDGRTAVVLETAHPAKFPEIVEEMLGFAPEPPESMKGLMSKNGGAVELPNDDAALKELLLGKRV